MTRPAANLRGPVDWSAIRRRVEAAGQALAGGEALGDEEMRRILESRARALARPAEQPGARERLDLVAFSLGAERYAIELRHVVEVFRLTNLSRLPGASAPVFGVTAWRGTLLTLLDLRVILGVPAERLDDLRIAVVLGDRQAPVGLLADGGEDLLVVDRQAVSPAPEGVAVKRDYVRGITADAVVLLDTERLLTEHGQEA